MIAAAIVLQALAASIVALYAVAQLHLLLRTRVLAPAERPALQGADVPEVLVQLPIRNERRVVQALLRSVAQLDWPRDRLRIQVLDDSDDETVELAAATVAALVAEGVQITHVQRAERTGYKAGALAHGLTLDATPFVLILDADFRPERDTLRRLLAQFDEPGIGLVQARWGHLNRDASWFTRAQAFHLDAHFSIEQRARTQAPLFMGFNGTAGVWRRACIDAAGGWSADTLTEDLDLAFRAQLAGWKLRYVDTIAIPAELPEDVRAIRTQQHRWMKGGAQVARKLLGPLWRSDRPLVTKLQGTAHLLGGTVFLAVLVLCLLTPLAPVLLTGKALWIGVGLQFSLVVLVLFYGTMCVRREGASAGVWRFATTFVPFLSMSTGLCLHNSLAVLEGFAGIESPFVRTPKRGVSDGSGALYTAGSIGWRGLVEVLLCTWGTAGLLGAAFLGQWVLAGFLGTQAAGFAMVSVGGLQRRSA